MTSTSTEQVSPLIGTPTGALAEAMARLGTDGLAQRRSAVQRLVAEEGITYGGTMPGETPRPWRLDPLPVVVQAEAWAGLEKGLEQRARLMDALYTDLYGRRRTISERLLPPQVVFGHSGFLPAADQVRLPGKRQVVLGAADLAQRPDGSWLVLSDRVQAPSGAGYAMANRRVIARAMSTLHRGTALRRLRGFFDVVQAALRQVAPPLTGEVPHVVLLTPGPTSESAYDQAMLSTLLGHPLVQSDDLVMRDGRVWMRTTGRLSAVDVLLRRVDADWCDSLDLRAESRLGVPGLAAASARGTLSVVNPLGTGVLENPGLAPHLEQVCRLLLGESPLLAGVPTWWCGDDASRSHVLARLEQLVVKPIARGLGQRAILGWELDAAGRQQLRERITAEPWRWTGQEAVEPATAPVVGEQGLAHHPMVLRGFTAALGSDVHVMPGGLARVAARPDDFVVTSAKGAWSKDVWVMEGSEPAPDPLSHPLVVRSRAAAEAAPLPGLAPRAAANLYWMGRYAERTETVARLVLVTDNLVEDHHGQRDTGQRGAPGQQAMARMLAAAGSVAAQPQADGAHPLELLRRLLVDPDATGSGSRAASALVRASTEVREMLSFDTSIILSGLERTFADAHAEADQVRLQAVASRVLESCLALSGLSAESLVHDDIWAFLEAGRRIERAQSIVRLLRSTLTEPQPAETEVMVVESVLRAGESLLTHRRRMAAGVGQLDVVASALELLLSDQSNPRSVLNQLQRLQLALTHSPDAQIQTEARRLEAMLRRLDPAEMAQGERHELARLLAELDEALRGLNDLVEATHFVAQKPQTSFAVPELSDEDAMTDQDRDEL